MEPNILSKCLRSLSALILETEGIVVTAFDINFGVIKVPFGCRLGILPCFIFLIKIKFKMKLPIWLLFALHHLRLIQESKRGHVYKYEPHFAFEYFMETSTCNSSKYDSVTVDL
jgi:hypothetical protein